jgi:hypothetical protein
MLLDWSGYQMISASRSDSSRAESESTLEPQHPTSDPPVQDLESSVQQGSSRCSSATGLHHSQTYSRWVLKLLALPQFSESTLLGFSQLQASPTFERWFDHGHFESMTRLWLSPLSSMLTVLTMPWTAAIFWFQLILWVWPWALWPVWACCLRGSFCHPFFMSL